MGKSAKSIPVNTMADNCGPGIAIETMSFEELRTLDEADSRAVEEARQSHREARHSFFFLESGTVHVEIDFQTLEIEAPSLIYMHPDQVHRIIAIEGATVSSLAINNESLNPAYLKLLEELRPAKPLVLEAANCSIISEALSLCIKFSRRQTDRLYHSLLRDSCNAFIA